MLALGSLKGLVIIDEVQRLPGLFKVLRVLVDRPQKAGRFLILGSASPELLKQSSESLAGCIAYLEIQGFSLQEVGVEALDALWLRGGFPKSFLAPSEEMSVIWRREFVQTFLERDLPQLGIKIPAITMRRFWTCWRIIMDKYGMEENFLLLLVLVINSTSLSRHLNSYFCC